MRRKLIAAATAFALAIGAAAPAAYADPPRGYRGGGHDGGRYEQRYDRHQRYDRRRHDYRRGRHDDNDALAVGVVGLVLGLALGAALSDPGPPRANCTDNYQRCAPPQQYYPRQSGPPPQSYNQGYDEDSAYARDYGYAPAPQSYQQSYQQRPACTRAERQWDRYANQYVTVDVPC